MNKQYALGTICILIGILTIATLALFFDWRHIFWLSNQLFLLLGIFLMCGSRRGVASLVCIGLIPELHWTIEFIASLAGHPIWGFTSYMFIGSSFNWLHSYSLQHVFFAPTAIYALFIMKGSIQYAWGIAYIHAGVLYLISRWFPSWLNLNCVWQTCVFDMPLYAITWPALITAMIAATYGVLVVCFNWFEKKHEE